jgi:hypothetical protein
MRARLAASSYSCPLDVEAAIDLKEKFTSARARNAGLILAVILVLGAGAVVLASIVDMRNDISAQRDLVESQLQVMKSQLDRVEETVEIQGELLEEATRTRRQTQRTRQEAERLNRRTEALLERSDRLVALARAMLQEIREINQKMPPGGNLVQGSGPLAMDGSSTRSGAGSGSDGGSGSGDEQDECPEAFPQVLCDLLP